MMQSILFFLRHASTSFFSDHKNRYNISKYKYAKYRLFVVV